MIKKNKLTVEFVVYVDKTMRVNDYKNPFTDEKYVESIRELMNNTREGVIVVMDGKMYEMMERSSVRIPSIVLFDYEHEDNDNAKFINSYEHLLDFLRNRCEKMFVIGGFDSWSSLIQYAQKIHFLVQDEKWNDDITKPFLFDVREMCKMISYSTLQTGVTHEEYEFRDDVVICNCNVREHDEYGLFCTDVLSHVNSQGELVDNVLWSSLYVIIESGDTLSIITDFKIYKTSPNIKIWLSENPRLSVLGVHIKSWEIVNGRLIISFVNNSAYCAVLDYRKMIAVLHITGDYKLLCCNTDFCENPETDKLEIEQVKHL